MNEDGAEVPTGQVGELCIKGLQVMAGYYQKPEENEKAFFPGRYFRTGDVGLLDEEGFFRIIDRKKDIIIVSGFNVYPSQLNGKRLMHDDYKPIGLLLIKKINLLTRYPRTASHGREFDSIFLDYP